MIDLDILRQTIIPNLTDVIGEAKNYSQKNVHVREAVVKFIHDLKAKGGLYDALDLGDLRKIAHLTDPQLLCVWDDEKVADALKKADAVGGVTQSVRTKLARFLHLDAGNVQILLLPTPAARAMPNGRVLLHELIHHAEFRNGLFDHPDHGRLKAYRERNAEYYDRALDQLLGINTAARFLTRNADWPMTEGDLDNLEKVIDGLKQLVALENGSGTHAFSSEDGIKLRIAPDLVFLREAVGLDLNHRRVLKFFQEGGAGPKLARAMRLIGPIISLEDAYEKELMRIRLFADGHAGTPAEREQYVSDGRKRLDEKFAGERAYWEQLWKEFVGSEGD